MLVLILLYNLYIVIYIYSYNRSFGQRGPLCEFIGLLKMATMYMYMYLLCMHVHNRKWCYM